MKNSKIGKKENKTSLKKSLEFFESLKYFKRGALLTLGITFVSLTVLTLATLLLRNAETSEERLAEFGAFDRIYNLDASVQVVIRDIIKTLSSLNMTVNGTNVTFEKSLFYNKDQNYEDFRARIEFYDELIKTIEPLVDIDSSGSSSSICGASGELLLAVKPVGLNYSYFTPSSSGYSEIKVSFNDSTIKFIDFKLNVSKQHIVIKNNTVGTIPYVLVVSGPNNYKNIGQGFLDPSALIVSSSPTINISNFSQGEMRIYVGKTSNVPWLFINSTLQENVNNAIKFQFKIPAETGLTEQIGIYTKEAIHLSIPGLSLKKDSVVKVI